MSTFIERDSECIMQTYGRLPIMVERADGCRIFDTEGNSYLDFLAGIAVNALGHSHPKVVEAVCEQAKKYMHVSNFLYQEPQMKLAEMLQKQAGYGKAFFTNSGAESMESALKLARKWGNKVGKTDIYGFSGGFHGRTYGALSVMDRPKYKDGMGPFLPNCYVLPFNDSEALRSAVDDKTCAVVLEFLQGEGGVTLAKKEFVDTIVELQKQFDFLIIADEIQAGVGRTGKFFGFQHYDVQPEIITMAKGMGGGMPLGAILVKSPLCSVWEKGMHGTTYGGNAVACAAGIAVMEELENGVQENVLKTGEYFSKKLYEIKAEFPEIVKEVRGRGLLLGLLLSMEGQPLVNMLLKHNIISNATAVNVLRIVPPLIVHQSDVDEYMAALRICLSEISVKAESAELPA